MYDKDYSLSEIFTLNMTHFYNPYPEETNSFNSLPKECPLHLLPYGIMSELIVPKISEIQIKERERIIQDVVNNLGNEKMKYYLLKLYYQDKEHKIINLRKKVRHLNKRAGIIEIIKEQEIPTYYLLKFKEEYINRPKLRVGDHVVCRDYTGRGVKVTEGIFSLCDGGERDHYRDTTDCVTKMGGYIDVLKVDVSKPCGYDRSDYEVSTGCVDNYDINDSMKGLFFKKSVRGIVCREHVHSWKCEILPHNEELHRLREERWIQAYEEHQYHYDFLNKLLPRLRRNEVYNEMSPPYCSDRLLKKIILTHGYDPADKSVWDNVKLIKPEKLKDGDCGNTVLSGLPSMEYKSNMNYNGMSIIRGHKVKTTEFIIQWMKDNIESIV